MLSYPNLNFLMTTHLRLHRNRKNHGYHMRSFLGALLLLTIADQPPMQIIKT